MKSMAITSMRVRCPTTEMSSNWSQPITGNNKKLSLHRSFLPKYSNGLIHPSTASIYQKRQKFTTRSLHSRSSISVWVAWMNRWSKLQIISMRISSRKKRLSCIASLEPKQCIRIGWMTYASSSRLRSNICRNKNYQFPGLSPPLWKLWSHRKVGYFALTARPHHPKSIPVCMKSPMKKLAIKANCQTPKSTLPSFIAIRHYMWSVGMA